jgi:uncharacterized protein YndB with AHSA1/START domain
MTTRNRAAIVTTPSDCEIVITREFDAPARLVWRAMTEPELVKRWYARPGDEWVSCEIDLTVGGRWRYVMAADGFEMAWSGEYREIVPAERIVSTERFEPIPGAESVNTVTLAEKDGRTTLQTVVVHSSKENRDAHLASGMEGGMQDAFDRLEEVAKSL